MHARKPRIATATKQLTGAYARLRANTLSRQGKGVEGSVLDPLIAILVQVACRPSCRTSTRAQSARAQARSAPKSQRAEGEGVGVVVQDWR
jgi:hypothetical protein